MQAELPQTRMLINRGISEGFHPGAQVYISLHGKCVADIALGEARPDVPMAPDTVSLWMSSVKPVGSVAIAQLWERGLLDLDDRISRFIPEFGVRGKEQITIRHVLTHTGGFRAVPELHWSDSFEDAIAKICEAALEPRWVPGVTAGYHPASGWYVLAELVRRIDGRPYDNYVREAIFQPLGMSDCWVGMPRQVYRSYGRQLGFIYDTSDGEPRSNIPGNSEGDAAAVRPGANGRGPIRQLARLYEMLLFKGRLRDSPRLLLPQTVDALTARHRAAAIDLTFKHVLDFGLGLIINSHQYGPDTVPYSYGPHASPRAFGHSGQQSSCAFCDPVHGLVVSWVCNGMPGEERHQARQRSINRTIYEELKLTI
jgi:CubicO group peptidase (beta-lactamase class C family)